MTSERERQIDAFEQEAELLVVYQLDLIAQIEKQLRAVRHTLGLVEKLRSAPYRVGPELTNSQRRETLETLSDELTELESQLAMQHESCADIQKTIAHMQGRLDGLRKHARTVAVPRRDVGSEFPQREG
jgi:hypothetical protein